MQRAILEVIACGAVKAPEDLKRYAHATLLAAQEGQARALFEACCFVSDLHICPRPQDKLARQTRLWRI